MCDDGRGQGCGAGTSLGAVPQLSQGAPQKYYAHRLAHFKRLETTFEIMLVLGTSGTIGAWAIWKTGVGQHVWSLLAAVAVLLGLLKPFFQVAKQVERCSKLWAGYSELYFDLEKVVQEIQVTKCVPAEIVAFQSAIFEGYRKLELEGDLEPIVKLQRRCFEEVNEEIPPESLWLPEEGSSREGDPGSTIS